MAKRRDRSAGSTMTETLVLIGIAAILIGIVLAIFGKLLTIVRAWQ